MKWYYESEGEQAGPVSDEELQALADAGKINLTTLVWNPELSYWKEYGEILASKSPDEDQKGAPRIFCCECHRSFSRDDMIQYRESWVCADCKPVFVQKLKEGISLSQLRYAGFWIRAAAAIIDSIITGVLNLIIWIPYFIYVFNSVLSENSVASFPFAILINIISFLIAVTYETFFVGKWGATIGKMACGLKVVSPEGDKISYTRALARYFAKILSVMILAIGYIIAAFDDEKRTLHDRICSTRVIRK